MTSETQKRLQPMLDKAFEHMILASGFSSYEEGLASLRVTFQDKGVSPAAFIHKQARELYPTSEPDTVNHEMFYEILGLINTKEKMNAVLTALPESSASDVEELLRFLLKEYLPSQRAAAQTKIKHLPQRRKGGAPSKMPTSTDCQSICDEINSLHRRGVLLGDAQRQIAKKWNKSLRTIQRVWHQRTCNG